MKNVMNGFSLIEILLALLIFSYSLFALLAFEERLTIELIRAHQSFEQLIKLLNDHEKKWASRTQHCGNTHCH